MTNVKSTPLVELPVRLHHSGFVVRDQEVNRSFMEDVLGIPLAATWCEVVHSPELNREVEFCHTFFALADGSALAFFQFADPELYVMCQAKVPPEVTRFDHIGFKVSEATFAELFSRLTNKNYTHGVIEHGYCKSLYVKSPDGLELEFAIDPPDSAEIIDSVRRSAHADLANWLIGDHSSNNDFKKD